MDPEDNLEWVDHMELLQPEDLVHPETPPSGYVYLRWDHNEDTMWF